MWCGETISRGEGKRVLQGSQCENSLGRPHWESGIGEKPWGTEKASQADVWGKSVPIKGMANAKALRWDLVWCAQGAARSQGRDVIGTSNHADLGRVSVTDWVIRKATGAWGGLKPWNDVILLCVKYFPKALFSAAWGVKGWLSYNPCL